jgi:hypothetical protein
MEKTRRLRGNLIALAVIIAAILTTALSVGPMSPVPYCHGGSWSSPRGATPQWTQDCRLK